MIRNIKHMLRSPEIPLRYLSPLRVEFSRELWQLYVVTMLANQMLVNHIYYKSVFFKDIYYLCIKINMWLVYPNINEKFIVLLNIDILRVHSITFFDTFLLHSICFYFTPFTTPIWKWLYCIIYRCSMWLRNLVPKRICLIPSFMLTPSWHS